MTDLTKVGARRTTVDISVQMIGRMINLLLGIVVTVVLVRYLGTGGFGRWSTILATVQITQLLGDFGLEQVAARHAAQDKEREGYWIGSLITFRLALSLPITLVIVAVLILLSNNISMLIAGLLVAATCFPYALNSLIVVYWLRIRNDLTVTFELLHGALWCAAVILVTTLGAGLVGTAAAYLFVVLTTELLLSTVALRLLKSPLAQAKAAWKQLFKIGLPVGIATLLTIAYGRIDQVLVFELAGTDEAGLYGSAYRFLERLYFIPGAIMATIFPMLAATYSTHKTRARRLLAVALEYSWMVALPAFGLLLIIARPLIKLLYGASFESAAPAMQVLMLAFVVISLAVVTNQAMIAFNKQRILIYIASIALLFNVVANVIFIPIAGFMAAAWITLFTELLVLALSLPVLYRECGPLASIKQLLKIAIATTVMTGFIKILALNSVPWAFLIVTGGTAYIGLLFLLKALSFKQLKQLINAN